MKKLLIASLLLTGLTAFVSSASARCHDLVLLGYDRCGRPVYGQVDRPSYGYYEERPAYYYRQAPPLRYHPYECDDYPRGRESRRHSFPLSFFFGF